MFLKLRFELVNDGNANDSVLRTYGKVKEGFTRDILISSDFTLHQMHYAIQRSFGWQNQHPHFFTFPKDAMISLFQALAKEGQKTPLYVDWEKVCGIYFRHPIRNEVTFNEGNILYSGELIQLLERLPVAELLLPEGTTAQQGWQVIVHNLIDTDAAANAENMEEVKFLKEAIRKAIDLEKTDEKASERMFCKAYGDYQRFVPQFDPHVIPIAKELIYFYDYEAVGRSGSPAGMSTTSRMDGIIQTRTAG